VSQLVSLEALTAFVIALSVGLGSGVVAYLLSRLFNPEKPSRVKQDRYETGNPPRGRARGWFMMHYYAYLLVFLSVEPVAIGFFVVLPAAGSSVSTFLGAVRVLFLSLAILAPALVFSLDAAKRDELWTAREQPR